MFLCGGGSSTKKDDLSSRRPPQADLLRRAQHDQVVLFILPNRVEKLYTIHIYSKIVVPVGLF